MIALHRISRQISFSIFKRSFSNSVAPKATRAPLDEKPENKTPTETGSSKIPRNPIVAAAFASLNDETISVPAASTKFERNRLFQLDEMIINAKTVDGLLALTEQNAQITRKHALKIVSILAEWSSINKVKLNEFENDSRFIKLCRVLGRTTMKTNGNNTEKKVTGFRTDDLHTVLGVTGDDEAAKLIASITLPQMVKVMSTLAQKKRRSTPLLRSLSYNICSSTNTLDLKQSGDLLYAMAVLNFPDPVLTGRICMDIQAELAKNTDKPAVVGSIITSLGLLRYRDSEMLEILSEWVLKHHEICRPHDIAALFLTLASINYYPTNIDQIKSVLVSNLCENDLQRCNDWLNLVWSLVVLECATPKLVESVLKPEFLENLEMERNGSLTPTIKMKLLNINAAANLFFQDFKGIKFKDDHSIFNLQFKHTKEKQILVSGMLDALKSLLPSENHVKISKDTKMGFTIDAECMLDAKCLPLPVEKEHKNGKRIAIMVHDYRDMCQGTHQTLNGVQILAIKLLEKSGYCVLTVPYTEFNTSDKLLKRVQYLEKKFKDIVSGKK